MASISSATKAFLVFGILCLCFSVGIGEESALKVGFYRTSCPPLNKIVKKTVKRVVERAPAMAPTLLRMHFHDCFVRGCDGSVLLNSTANNTAEKDAIPNRSVRGFNVIDSVKVQVEKHCPGVVSCADILSLVARDAVLLTFGGPYWDVPTGRRDGRISLASEALANIPSPNADIQHLKQAFAAKGLSARDLVVLSGAHTVGIAHCGAISRRLYNFNGNGAADPSLDSVYVRQLRRNVCKSPNDTTSIVQMDPGSYMTFDLSYFYALRKRRGVFVSDSELLQDTETEPIVKELSEGSEEDALQRFFLEFKKSMEKMASIGVLSGSQGEIRRYCSLVNE